MALFVCGRFTRFCGLVAPGTSQRALEVVEDSSVEASRRPGTLCHRQDMRYEDHALIDPCASVRRACSK
jgi:hypothetical protein